MGTEPYGSWASPLSVEHLTSASTGLAAVRIDGDQLYWLESRADQGGRSSVWRRSVAGGEPTELTPAPAYVRDRVHEYGGGEFDVDGGVVVYSEFTDGRVYRLRRRRAGCADHPDPGPSATAISDCISIVTWCSPCARTTAATASR